jgi:hypothetical protein
MTRFTLALAAWLLLSTAPSFAAGSLADVTIFDRTTGRSLPAYGSSGQTFVAGKPGNEYAIRIRNRMPTAVLAVVSVDGVNVVSGETAATSQGGYVIPARGYLEIKGWRKSLERIAAFYFTDLGDSYAARTGRPDDVGVIGVALFRPRVEPAARLEDRASRQQAPAADGAANGAAPQEKSAERSAPEPALGTGHGRSETSHARFVEFDRESDMPNEVIAIRYDSHANLVAMGVIQAPRPRHVPEPFPAVFVPDPPARW